MKKPLVISILVLTIGITSLGLSIGPGVPVTDPWEVHAKCRG